LYNDTILNEKKIQSVEKKDQTLYLKHFLATCPNYKITATILSVFRAIEALTEMIVERKWGSKIKWRIVWLIEFIK
jgi:hypothetical protein